MTEALFLAAPLVIFFGSKFVARMPMRDGHKIKVSYD